MFTLDTELFTPSGFIEAWELFEEDELVDSNNQKHTIQKVIERTEEVCLITLEDFTTLKLAKRIINNYDLKVGSDLILSNPVRYLDTEDGSVFPWLVQRQEGVDFGSYGKYQFIPYQYLYSFVENRKKFFQGLLFSQSVEGHTENGFVYFLVAYAEFADNLVTLAKSLGGNGNYHMFYSDGEYYEVTIELPTYFEEGVPARRIHSIEEIGKEETLEFITEQKDFITGDYLKIEKEETNESKEHID